MFDIWQSRAAQQVQSVADVQEIDVPKVTGVTQLNSYYQSVLGAPGNASPQGPSNAVTVAGELNAYLGSGAANEIGATRFPSSRNAVGHVAPVSETDAASVDFSGLLPASAPVRAQAQAGEWAALAAWKVTPGTSSAPGGTSRELIADRAIHGDLSRYAAAFQAGVVPPASQSGAPRVTSREVAAFMDFSDYSHSADPRAAAGERAEDVPARQVADLVGGFTQLPPA